jgi:Sulfatase
MNSPKTRKNQFKLFLALTLIGSITLTNNTIASTPPNILFIIMDDVGIDQMKSFGYGGITAPVMTNIDQIAANGVRFRNNWSMPACTPSFLRRKISITYKY